MKMDIPSFSNISYVSGNMVVEDSSTLLAKNIANVIPTIHDNIKRALHLNVRNQPGYSQDNVPAIEVIPPSPPGRKGKKSFVGIKLDKVLNQTFKVCRRYSMPYIIHPSHLGDNLQKDVTSRRSSMPLISSKYLLQVPKPEKKKRRRHSLPVNMDQVRESFSQGNKKNRHHHHHHTHFDFNEDFTTRSQDDLSFDGRVHQVYISGFISDNNNNNNNTNSTFENSKEVPSSRVCFRDNNTCKQTLRRKNESISLSKMVDNDVERSKSTQARTRDLSKSVSNETDLDAYLSLDDLGQDDNSDSTNFSLRNSASEEKRRTNKGRQTNTELIRKDINRKSSRPLDIEPNNSPSRVNPHVNYERRDGRDKINKHTEDHDKTCLRNYPSNRDSNNHRFICGDILVKRGNKGCYMNDDALDSGFNIPNITLNDHPLNNNYPIKNQQTTQCCNCSTPNSSFHSHTYTESINNNNNNFSEPRFEDDDDNYKLKPIDILPNITSMINSLTVVDQSINIVSDNKSINKKDLSHGSDFIDRQTSCESIKANNNKNDPSDIYYKSAEEFRETGKELRSSNCGVNNSERFLRQDKKEHKEYNKTFYDDGIEICEIDVNYYSDDLIYYDYDFNTSPTLERSSSMSHIHDILNRSKNHHRRHYHRPVSYHEDSVDINMFGDFNGHEEYDTLMGNTRSSLDELDNRNDFPVKSNFTNNMFRKAASLCELQNEKVKEGFAKLERKVHLNDRCPKEETTDDWFPRLSYEDCSSCTSCRSKSSSYHSLLYDTDTASGYQIYQPTVCDVGNITAEVEKDHCVREESKMTVFKSRKDRFMKQGQDALGTFKDKLKKTKSNPFKS